MQLFERTADARGPGDDAHARRNVELGDGVAQFVAVLAFDAPRHAAAARIVGHQDQIASRQRHERGQRGALVAALVLVDLDDEFLAFLDRVLDAQLGRVRIRVPEIGAADFLEGEKAVPFRPIVDEAGFERRFDPGDDAFVDIALALLFGCRFDVEIDQFLTVDDRHPQFFGLGGIE